MVLKALPSFSGQKEKQFLSLLARLGKIKLTTEQVVKIFSVFDEDLWGDQSDELKSAMANSNAVDAKLPRKQNQDCLALLNCIPMILWESLEKDDRMMALEKLANHSIKLGLQHPTEATQGLLLACVFDRAVQLMEAQRWKITEQYKASLKRFFDRAPDPPVYLKVLPSDLKEFPKILWDRTFSGVDGPVAIGHARVLLEVGKSWPMRATHSSAASARVGGLQSDKAYVTKEEFFAFGSMMAGAFRREEKNLNSVPGLQVLKPSAASMSSAASPAMLAIQDDPTRSAAGVPEPVVSPEGAATEPVRASAPSAPGTVETSLAALRESCREKKEQKGVAKTSKAKPHSWKKPASKALKRPAAKKTHGQGTSLTPASDLSGREARRQRILALVPSKLKNKFRDGCARCYWRAFCTPSCWQLRGYGCDL